LRFSAGPTATEIVKQSPSAADKDTMLRLALTLSVAALAAAFAALFGSR
jgi:hypothetical protein